jgi:hypothetical protein
VSRGATFSLRAGKEERTSPSSWGQISSEVVPERVLSRSVWAGGKESWWGCWYPVEMRGRGVGFFEEEE